MSRQPPYDRFGRRRIAVSNQIYPFFLKFHKQNDNKTKPKTMTRKGVRKGRFGLFTPNSEYN